MRLPRKPIILLPIVALALAASSSLALSTLRGVGTPGLGGGRDVAPIAVPPIAPMATPVPSQAGRLVDSAKAVGGAAAPAAAPPMAESHNEFDRSLAVASQQAAFLDQKIIRTGSINLTVQNVDKSLDEVTRIVREVRGTVFSTNRRQEGDHPMATLSLRVPVDSFDEVMSALRQLAVKVNDESSSGQDVTEEFTDLEAQRRNLEAVEAQYQDLLKRATTIDDILKIQNRLTDVQGQIERIKGRMNYLDRRATFSTITVTLVPPLAANAQPTSSPGWDPVKVAERAWEASLRMLRGVAEVIITVVVFGWWLIPLAVAAWYIATSLRGRRANAH